MNFDLNKMFKQVQKMQEKMGDIQEKLGAVEVTGSAGGGAVQVTCTGKLEFTRVKISPEALTDAGLLEDMVLTALRDAADKVSEVAEKEMSALTAGLKIPGLKMPF